MNSEWFNIIVIHLDVFLNTLFAVNNFDKDIKSKNEYGNKSV